MVSSVALDYIRSTGKLMATEERPDGGRVETWRSAYGLVITLRFDAEGTALSLTTKQPSTAWKVRRFFQLLKEANR
ncbi:hypothetical protein ACWGA9_06240 [Streptomyces sp. NPDC054950]